MANEHDNEMINVSQVKRPENRQKYRCRHTKLEMLGELSIKTERG